MNSPITCVVPAPAHVRPSPGDSYLITDDTRVRVDDSNAATAHYLAETLGVPTASEGDITLTLHGADPRVGDAGYHLTVTRTGVTLAANTDTGLFAGVQTVRQLVDG